MAVFTSNAALKSYRTVIVRINESDTLGFPIDPVNETTKVPGYRVPSSLIINLSPAGSNPMKLGKGFPLISAL